VADIGTLPDRLRAEADSCYPQMAGLLNAAADALERAEEATYMEHIAVNRLTRELAAAPASASSRVSRDEGARFTDETGLPAYYLDDLRAGAPDPLGLLARYSSVGDVTEAGTPARGDHPRIAGRVRAFYAHDRSTRAVGTVIGWTDEPTVLVEYADGSRETWLRHLTEPAVTDGD